MSKIAWNKGKKLHYPVWNKGLKGVQISWNKGKKGLQVGWNKGLTKETNLSVAKSGINGGISRTGKKLTKEHCINIGKAHLGLKHLKDCTCGTCNRSKNQWGANNPLWKNFPAILTYEFLYHEYVELRKTSHRIAKEIGCGKNSVTRYLKKHGIHVRNLSEATSMENNPRWQGGISFEPYSCEFTDELKERIRKRDNYQCQNRECNITEEENLIVFGRVLDIHHVNYDKKNCADSNLITLCRQCNCRANVNKQIWIKYYSEILTEGIKNENT